MRNIIDFIEEYDNTITEDLDIILESELIEEGFFGKLKAAWNGLKDCIKSSPSWNAYQEKQKRYAEVDKEIEDKYNSLKEKAPKVKETIKKQNKKEEIKPEESKESKKYILDVAQEMILQVERLNKVQTEYKEILDLGKEVGLKNIKAARDYIAKDDKKK